MPEEALLEISQLKLHFFTDKGVVKAVDGVDLTVKEGEVVGLVGESGCGKSVTSLAVMGLVEAPGRIVGGSIRFGGRDLTKLSHKEMRQIRGNEIAMIFQEPMTSLNPVYTIGNQIMEAIRLHQKVDKKEARERAIEMLRLVGIPAPEKRVDEYPHQLSGGMRQRAMIAMALSCNPSLLIADEPTTALDVTIQAQILELMERLQEEFEMAIMMITHDLGVVAGMADEVAVMYLGQIVEHSDVRSVFKSRYHPYTEGLMGSIPVLGSRVERLTPIQGMVPDPRWMPEGCRFADRCPKRMPVCDQPPPVLEPDPGHFARCWLYDPEVNTDA